MQVGNFELTVYGVSDDELGYVKMTHGLTYKLGLYNHSNLRVNAKVKIDGKDVGAWRIQPNNSIVLERPSLDTGQFTFYRQHSEEANLTGLHSVESVNLGVISVTFVPEKSPQRQRIIQASLGAPESFGFESTRGSKGLMGAGGTGLSGESNQKFTTASHIEEDWDNSVTINLRLVEDLSRGIRPLKSIKSNPVPPPVK